MSKRELLARLEAVEAKLSECPAHRLDGQEAISVATIGHHTYEGPGACRTDMFGETCGAHRDEHQLIDEDDQP
ncbi:hypothetical protein PV382_18005 [Streptomyces scabiei]|uniref:hypothetical protein n=1 Tax=Streptomyces scabiei TaxID=1930 RepID=UPI000A53B673|nr:hypothetical protein [Streptomyces scabiei]MDX2996395.1 hypothetical protein [Streptomyces scabiei]MDX3049894.1 hypothetical protein [Streptomyces scabiei]MDX3174171.1 hypothetical protein [Streptomyces scabiei]